MTVGVVIVPGGVDEAVADASGRAAVRRIVDAAWAGGAMPIVVVQDDVDGHVAAVLVGSPALLVDDGGRSDRDAYRRGAEAAAASVRETSAVLLWPGRMTWADPETVTSLIEAHGGAPDSVQRPYRDGQPGWPVLLPVDRVEAILQEPGASLDEVLLSAADVLLELGDPGSVLGNEVSLGELPDYLGPREPVGGPSPEWGAAAADAPEAGLEDDERA